MSRIFRVKEIIDNQPTFAIPLSEILSCLKIGGAIKILSPKEYITEGQRNWYKGVCLPALVKNDENGETLAWWDREIKSVCNGLEYLKKEWVFLEDGSFVARLTTRDVGRKNMRLFIEEILSKAVERGWPVSAPDPELRRK